MYSITAPWSWLNVTIANVKYARVCKPDMISTIFSGEVPPRGPKFWFKSDQFENLTNLNGSMDIGRQWKGLRCVDQQPQKNLFQSQSWIGLGFPILGFNARPKLVPFECQFLCPVPVSGAWLLMSEGFWCNWSWWILSCVLHVWVITLILGPSLPAPSPTQGSHRRARCSPDKCMS